MLIVDMESTHSSTFHFFTAVDIYAGVAASLAERKKGGQLTEFLKNIRGTIDDDEWDQVTFTPQSFSAAFSFDYMPRLGKNILGAEYIGHDRIF